MINITVDGKKEIIKSGETAFEYVKNRLLEDNVLALKVNNRIVSGKYVLNENDSVVKLTIASDEGYLIYKETLILLLLDAAEKLYGYDPIIVRQSVNKSTYFELCTPVDNKEREAEKLKIMMKEIISESKSFEEQTVTKKEAAELFKKEGMAERGEEIGLLPAETVKLCKTTDRYHLTYQNIAYSVKSVNNFDIRPYEMGFLLRYPTNYTKTTIPYMTSARKIHRAIEDYREWITAINAGDIFSLNKYIRTGHGTDLVNMSEGLHEKRIIRIADEIKNNKDIRIILIAGPSASGKTTFANRLLIHLRINHIEPILISLDDYYVDDSRMPRDKNGEMDFERIEAIDYELFNKHLAEIASGKTVTLPHYDFKIRKRVEGKTVSLSDGQIIIAEGIHALNELLTSRVPKKNKFKIYLSALTSLCLDEYNAFSPTDNRLLRRIVRDAEHRNCPAEETFTMWKNVRKGEMKYIFPFESEADEVFNSSLVYELAVLKDPAIKLLSQIDKKSPHYSRAGRLMELLSYFETMNFSAIPPTSIIREFIGGSSIVN